jgi:acyl-CoA dehydrogenase
VPGNIVANANNATNANSDGQSTANNYCYLLNARKWFITGAAHPNCRLCIFMGQILHPPVEGHPLPPRHQRHTMVLVPMPSPGLSMVRRLSVFGNFDEPGGHCELLFENVIVPKENLVRKRVLKLTATKNDFYGPKPE